jgi:hypothetical protein
MTCTMQRFRPGLVTRLVAPHLLADGTPFGIAEVHLPFPLQESEPSRQTSDETGRTLNAC